MRRGGKRLSVTALIDTGALIALCDARDQYHARAARTARQVRAGGGRFLGSMLVLAEFHRLLVQDRGAPTARGLLEELLRDPFYEWHGVSTELVEAALSRWLMRFGDQRFTLADAVNFELMKRRGLTQAFAFDRDFLIAGFQLLA